MCLYVITSRHRQYNNTDRFAMVVSAISALEPQDGSLNPNNTIDCVIALKGISQQIYPVDLLWILVYKWVTEGLPNSKGRTFMQLTYLLDAG